MGSRNLHTRIFAPDVALALTLPKLLSPIYPMKHCPFIYITMESWSGDAHSSVELAQYLLHDLQQRHHLFIFWLFISTYQASQNTAARTGFRNCKTNGLCSTFHTARYLGSYWERKDNGASCVGPFPERLCKRDRKWSTYPPAYTRVSTVVLR